MPIVTIPFVGQPYEMPARQVDAQTCINWYLSSDPEGKFSSFLLPRPGLTVWSEDTAGSSVRGSIQLNNYLYVVIDKKFYSYDKNGNRTDIGTLNEDNLTELMTSTGPVRFVANDYQLFLTDGEHGYVYQITTPDALSQVVTDKVTGDFFLVENASSSVGDAVFLGIGMNDMTSGGDYTGIDILNYRIEIDSTGSGSTADTFKWSDDDGTTYTESISITGDVQTLNNGITVAFTHITGHTLNDVWLFSTTSDSAFYVPIIPAYQDTYGVYAKQVSTRWYISSQNQFEKVNALDFVRSASWPDNLVAAISIREELWLIGEETTEVWYNTGAATFPFQRRQNLVIRFGCCAPYSVDVADNNILLWFSRNDEGGRCVVMIDGYSAKAVSTEPMNAEFASYDTVEDAFAFVHQWNGHVFYTLTFPTENKTWVYDLTTGKWHERRSVITNEAPYTNEITNGRWIPNSYSYFDGKHLVGDFESGNIYELDDSSYTDNGTYFVCERTTRAFQQNLKQVTCHSLNIDFESGVGLTTGHGSDPSVMLQISRDGGKTWGNELWRSLGEIGQYKTRVKWNRLGTARDFTFRVRVTDPNYRVLIGAVAELEENST